jgi:polysaccharide export outer membrane protein
MRYFFYLLVTIVLFFSSCVSYKRVPYFQDLRDTSNIQEQIQNQTVLKIQKDDILAVSVTSLNPEASAIFNVGNASNSSPATGITPSTSQPNGFLVDQEGNIQLPLVGSIKVQGLSTSAARELISHKLETYLKQPVVSVRIVNFKVSVLGDVGHPGVFPLQSERVSVTEALSLAGDLNITALRNNVLLVREDDGKRQFIRLNMQSKDLFNSPYYYLKNNDVLYVQPGNAKYASVDSNYRNAGILLSVLSIIALVITRL